MLLTLLFTITARGKELKLNLVLCCTWQWEAASSSGFTAVCSLKRALFCFPMGLWFFLIYPYWLIASSLAEGLSQIHKQLPETAQILYRDAESWH